MSRKDERRKEVAELREAGRQAFAAGRHIQTCPERFMNRYQWEQGYLDAEAESHPHGAGAS